jgi:hypothetical protein
MRTLVLSALCAVILTGCAGTNRDLQRASARAMTPTPLPDSVAISEVRHDRLGNVRSWVATTRTAVYDCSLESDEHAPLCAKRDSPR